MSDKPRVYSQDELTYNSYLKVNELLSLQQCLSEPVHHDEMLFIIIHQAYELWFKLILLELENAMQYMAEGKVLRAHHFLKRVVEIQKVLVSQIHILETMTPKEFLGFRDRLNPASGFQSFQFREVEYIAGLKDESYFKHFKDQANMEGLRARLAGPDLWERFQRLLADKGYDVPEETIRPGTPAGPARERLMRTLTRLYETPEENMEIYTLAEALIDFDTQLSLWRFHHVHVVERVIGFKTGTGGSSGAGYLRGTIEKKAFPLLWEARTYIGGGGEAYSRPSPPPPADAGGGCPFGH